jgi:cobyrinic acid a,c-diamide synthase
VKHTFDIPRIVIAGASSNVGKTTITAGLIAALRQQGMIVQPFKCGPDYVDPSYHERAAGRPCRNLDTWMLSDTQLLESFARACQDADIAVVEGVMGLYDGSDWHDERGSTAQIAKLLNAPVLLVFDISGSARSAAAAVLGYKHFDPAVAIRGVVLNFAGSERHAQGCAEAIERTTTLPMMGWLPREMQLQIPERHLGLVPGGEQVDSDALIAQMAVAVSARFDVDGIVGVARGAAGARERPGEPALGSTAATARERRGEPALGSTAAGARDRTGAPSAGSHPGASDADIGGGDARPARHAGQVPDTYLGDSSRAHVTDPRRGAARPVIAVARDEAFCFYYPENLELLIEAGAAVEFFSPLRGERPGPGAAGVYLGGGYPELHGPALASNMGLWGALKDMHAADLPIYAECGGFMVLTTGLTDSDGHTWPMGGLLPGFARMSGKLAALGYRHATALRSNLLAEPGEALRGHEFRYSSWVRDIDVADDTAAWHVKGTRGEVPNDTVGYARGNLLASYLHVHFGQRRELAERFVQRLERAG